MNGLTTDARSLVVYFSAGAMSGVFSAGFSKALEEADLKKHVYAVYGNSAGGFTSLCFLSNQVEMGAQMYWEDLNGQKYIRWGRLPGYVLKGFSNKLFGTSYELAPVFDIDYIEHILVTKRTINFETIKNSGVKLYMIAYNLVTSRHEYDLCTTYFLCEM